MYKADVNVYHFTEGAARVARAYERTEVSDTLSKLRRHIFVFRNRRGWRDALAKQCEAQGIKARQIPLDMPVRWSSTYNMLETTLILKSAITALCASQVLDLSMKNIQLTPEDWNIPGKLRRLFAVFTKPSAKLQGKTYPTLSMAVLLYLRMMNKLRNLDSEWGIDSTMGRAGQAVLKKLDDYYSLAVNQMPSHSNIATILDPRMNLQVYDYLFPDSGRS